MLVATGAASSCQTGSVASTQPPRVRALGGSPSSEMVVASPSHRVASAKAWSRSVRCPVVTPRPSWFAMWSACRSAASHEISREGSLQLLHERLHHGRVDAHAGQARELFRVDALGAAPEQLAEELLELLLRAAIVVRHFSRLSAC